MPPLSWRVHSATCSDKMRSCNICKALNVNHFSSERSQLRWFDHVSRMSLETLARQVLLAALTRKRPRVRPKTRWSGYASDMGVVRIFSRCGPLGDFSKIFPGGSQKWWNFFFSHSKLRNQTFLLKILISKWPWPPLPPPFRRPWSPTLLRPVLVSSQQNCLRFLLTVTYVKSSNVYWPRDLPRRSGQENEYSRLNTW